MWTLAVFVCAAFNNQPHCQAYDVIKRYDIELECLVAGAIMRTRIIAEIIKGDGMPGRVGYICTERPDKAVSQQPCANRPFPIYCPTMPRTKRKQDG